MANAFDEQTPPKYIEDDEKVLTFEDEDEDIGLLEDDELDAVEEDEEEAPLENEPLDENPPKNESFGPEDIVPIAKQMEFKKQYLQGKDKRKVNPNSFYFDNAYAVDDNTGSNIPGAKLGMKYKELAAALDKFFGESSQKNEDNPHEKDWEEYRNGTRGSFVKYLALAFQQADLNNLKKLYNAFPDVGKKFALWKSAGKSDKV